MPDSFENPYQLISDWLRMEIYDLEGLRESIEGVRFVEKTINDTKKEITSLKEYVDDLNNEKTTFKKLWRTITLRSMTV